jgi:predicted DNA-binding transcriptional regulator AlpA
LKSPFEKTSKFYTLSRYSATEAVPIDQDSHLRAWLAATLSAFVSQRHKLPIAANRNRQMGSNISAAAVFAHEQPNRADIPSLEDEGFILLAELRSIIPLHPQHIRKMIKRGQFPPALKVGGRTCFRRSAIREFLRQQG